MIKSNLYKKDLYLNENILFLFNKEITEYDMAEAGFSLIQEFKMLPEKEIKKLKEMGKAKRKVAIGVLQRDNDVLKKNLKEAFETARKLFFDANDIEDDDILSIKKDAIITTRHCSCNKFGSYINFRPKHWYSSYILLNKKTELYYSPTDFAVKGISDDLLHYHEDYMIHFFKLYFKKMETEEPKTVIEFTKRFIDRYKFRELEVGYYRKFNNKSNYDIYNDSNIYMEWWDDRKEDVDITYNFYNVLIKLVKIPL